jgi:hypothetical protein
MAKDRSVTPEKQLLNLIEGSKGVGPSAHTSASVHRRLSFLSLDAWKGRLSFLRNNFQQLFKAKGSLVPDIKAINGILIVAVCAMTVYFAASIFTWFISMKKGYSFGDGIKPGAANYEETAEVAMIKRPITYYLEKVGARDIFKMGFKKVAAAEVKKETKATSSAIIDATQGLKLVGISWSKNPDAIIEDTKTGKTYFLKRGGLIGEVKVQAMSKDKVILSYGGEEIELR